MTNAVVVSGTTIVGTSVDGWRLTAHARERITQMKLDDETVLDALRYPSLTYPGSVRYKEGRECRQKGEVVVVIDGSRVITVLWHRKEGR